MIKNIFRITKFAFITGGILLTFFIFIELIRAYQTLRDMHPIAGYVYLAILAGSLAYVIIYVARTLKNHPPSLKRPKIKDTSNASPRRLRKYARYLNRYIARLATSPALDEHQQEVAQTGRTTLTEHVNSASDTECILTAIRRAEESTVNPLLEIIDDYAARHVRNCMRDVMIAVTLSPYKAADLIIVLYRNLMMVTGIIKAYNSRPRLREQLSIMVDVLAIVATVNYINMGKNLIEGLASRVPGIGKFVDDIAQGMGAGFMTTVCGHAAMQRCRAFTGWDAEAAKRNIFNNITDFYADVKNVFWKDIWPALRVRAGEVSTDMKDKIAATLDDTQAAVSKIVKSPFTAAYTATSSAVNVSTNGTKVVVNSAGKVVTTAGNVTYKTARSVVKTPGKLFRFGKKTATSAASSLRRKPKKLPPETDNDRE
ncbi:hypothetical protein STSP2_01558 [Anaerohalosphaera lusitana]|uniref:DUF697 domain-containing protein n=1 Tax=Anaerohalosphaera lusitana TaxID=1936003 RepID=A0A1U9NKZ4_9BACT|nr:YcjF family protein [Anaerohalosphaera lusitana]AQT68398.1 hypothetical protein STSP2_01558 [Anaerohalosphaera lusitana]